MRLYTVREYPPEMDTNEWQNIGIGQTIYTMSNTTQLIRAKLMANAIWQVPVVTLQKSDRGRLRSTGVFHIGNATQVNIQKQNFEKMIFLSKTYHPLKKCFLDRFSKFFRFLCQLHMYKNFINIL